MVLPSNPGPTLWTPRRLHWHATLADGKGMIIDTVVPMAGSTETHRRVNGSLLGIGYWLVEGCVTQHLFGLRDLVEQTSRGASIRGAEHASLLDLVLGILDEGKDACI